MLDVNVESAEESNGDGANESWNDSSTSDDDASEVSAGSPKVNADVA